MIATFNRFEIVMTKADAKSASHQGRCDDDVRVLMEDKKFMRQFKKIDKYAIREELKECGAWEDVELNNVEGNLIKIIWIAAGNIVEEM